MTPTFAAQAFMLPGANDASKSYELCMHSECAAGGDAVHLVRMQTSVGNK